MKVVGFDGRQYPWPPAGHHVNFDDRRRRSEPHLKCREMLRRLYPTDRFLEEIPLPGSDKLSADFYLPWRNLVIEVHGKQHYEFIEFFHATKLAFFQAKQRDLKKIEWCNMNNIGVVELPYNEDDDAWERRILTGA